jgi:hypothetical protein
MIEYNYNLRTRIYTMHVIFPCAGLGSRFGYAFKPFLKATEETFIEIAAKPFRNGVSYPHFVFVFTEAQEAKYDVSRRMKEMFENDNTSMCIIDGSTGPLETVQKAVSRLNLTGPAFVCDCDHSIDIRPILRQPLITGKSFDVILATHAMRAEDLNAWGKVKLYNGEIVSFCEKDVPPLEDGEYLMGLLGCHTFSNIARLLEYPAAPEFSTLYQRMLSEGKIKFTVAEVDKADFFGSPKLLNEYRFSLASTMTLFVDIDGTLLVQGSDCVIPGTVDKIKKWRALGHRIILTTASKVHTSSSMQHIPHDGFIAGLSSGPRVVINDRKPYLPFYQMAGSFELDRNVGIADISLKKYEPCQNVKSLPGASGDIVSVVSKDGEIFVRKYATGSNIFWLRRQYEEMKRFARLLPGKVPLTLSDNMSHEAYWYDMEYVENFEPLTKLSVKSKRNVVLARVLNDLRERVYVMSRPIEDPVTTLVAYLERAVYKNIQDCVQDVVINGVRCTGARLAFERLPLARFAAQVECPIHGDLTFENILYNSATDEYKLIDMAGADYVDFIELDLGKLYQSEIASYASWELFSSQVVVHEQNECEMFIPEFERPPWITDEATHERGLFYMCVVLCRILPYMRRRSESIGNYCRLLAHHHLHELSKI